MQLIFIRSARTKVDKRSADQDIFVSQHRRKPLVSGKCLLRSHPNSTSQNLQKLVVLWEMSKVVTPEAKEDTELQNLYGEINAAFTSLKNILDKYLKSFTLDYHPKEGYYIEYDFTYLVPNLRTLI